MLKKSIILYLFLLGIFLFFLSTAYALVCGGTCYTDGICCSDVWYEGCEDSNGNVYCPDQALDDANPATIDCLTCKCTGTSCEWQPSYQTCTDIYVDYTCDYDTAVPPSYGVCVDRDTSEAFCTDPACLTLVWTPAGELDTSYQSQIWEYSYSDTTTVMCCGDDSSEFYTTLGVGPGRCCDSATDCVDSGNTCRDNIENTLALCTDGIDNDCDGDIDCEDIDCAGSISGNVKDNDGAPISGALIKTLQFGDPANPPEVTDDGIPPGLPAGDYKIYDVKCTPNIGTYDLIASAVDYAPSTRTNVELQPKENLLNIDFTLVTGTTCQDDCTYAEDNIIHRECDGINGCEFCDPALGCAFCDKSVAKNSCDLAQPGWIRNYDDPPNCDPDGCTIECAETCPQAKVAIKAIVTCEEENLIKLIKVITYKGKLVKLVIVTCG